MYFASADKKTLPGDLKKPLIRFLEDSSGSEEEVQIETKRKKTTADEVAPLLLTSKAKVNTTF